MLALVDSDILLYEVGFTTEDKDEAVAFARMDERIHAILDAVSRFTGGKEDNYFLPEYQCYLSDSKENNFRYKIDTTYKGNRTQPKPRHYEVLKEYLIVEHGAKIAYGMEADDALGIAQNKEWDNSPTTVICSIDKDLDQIPGYHYSWPINRSGNEIRPEKFYLTSPDEGILFFWRQMLIGDTADNIKGIAGIGKVGAERLLDSSMFEKDMLEIVREKYEDQYGIEEGNQKMLANGKLLYIKRKEDYEWVIPVYGNY